MNWIQRFLTAIATHKADVAAHHAKTTAGELNLADMAERAHGSLTGVLAAQHHAKTVIGDLAPIALANLDANVCSEAEADNKIAAAMTKEFFTPATVGSAGTTVTAEGYFPGVLLNAVGEAAYASFHIPHDFSNIVEAVFVCIAKATQAAADWDIHANYASNGELKNAHTEQDIATTYNVTNLTLHEVDISGILTAIVPGDYVGVALVMSTGGHNLHAFGVRFKYS